MKYPVTLGDIQETLLIPLYARALEARSPEAVIRDRHAADIVDRVAYDFSKLNNPAVHVGAVLRTAVFDEMVRAFLDRHPDGTVTDLGAGLNARFERLDNGRAGWIDVDLPDSIALRRRFLAESPRRRMLASSAVEREWAITVKHLQAPHMVTAEGVLGYLQPADVKTTLTHIAEHLPGARVAFDTLAPLMVQGRSVNGLVPGTRARIVWTCSDPREIERWGLGYRLLESRTLADLPLPVEWRLPLSYRCWLAIGRANDSLRLGEYRINLYSVGG